MFSVEISKLGKDLKTLRIGFDYNIQMTFCTSSKSQRIFSMKFKNSHREQRIKGVGEIYSINLL